MTASAATLSPVSVVENNDRATRLGGITGAGFQPGVSGNPGGRPRGLARQVRELVGEDGEAIATFLLTVMSDEAERTRDRLEAARLLADRGWGEAVQAVDMDVTQQPGLDFSRYSMEDLGVETLISVIEKYAPSHA